MPDPDFSLAAGRLRHRVHIQTRADTQNTTTGEVTTAWTSVYEDVPCAIESLSVKEFLQSKTEQESTSVRIVMYLLRGLTYTADMRLLGACACHEGKIYNPQGWLEDKETAQAYITAPCSEGVNEG